MTSSPLLTEWEGERIDVLAARWGVPELIAFARTGSTNDVARDLAERGAAGGTTVLADEQTAGKGRLGRRWVAPPTSALLLSVVLRPPGAGDGEPAAGALPLRIGLAVAEAVDKLSGLDARLKWPNDVLAPSGRKLAGILCEAATASTSPSYVIAGVGINVSMTREAFPADIRESASSILLECGHAPSRADLAGLVVPAIITAGSEGLRPLSERELEMFAERDTLRGREIAVDERVAGRAAGIDRLGALLVRNAGTIERVHAGTVRVVGRVAEVGT